LPLDGILIIDKPAGLTSRRVVSRVAELTGERKAGHAGTLDPLATGVLVTCLGRATLLSSYLAAGLKRYSTGALLGVETDTYDTDGRTVCTGDTSGVTREKILEAIEGMTGMVSQVPPAYSAVKHQGKPLYRYARSGEAVQARSRTVYIESIDLAGLEQSENRLAAHLDIVCGPGTYVRSLVHDLGATLGCGACVESLRRTASGAFDIASSITLEELECSSVGESLISLEDATREMPSAQVGDELATAVSMGKPIPVGSFEVPEQGATFRVMDEGGTLVALYGPPRVDDEGIAARAVRVVRPHPGGTADEAA